MPTFFAAPTYFRQGVVAGFVLSAPNVSGTPGTPYGGPVVFTFYNSNVTISGTAIKIGVGYQHFVTIAGHTYAYVQQSGDSVATIVAALANAINGAPDLYAIATAGSSTVSLAPRLDTGAVIYCTASDGNSLFSASQLPMLTGNNLIPTITKGVLYAQGILYRPSTAPVLTAAAANAKSYLYYSSTSGWYWSASSTPTGAADDACVGWVRTNSSEVIAVSSRRIGDGDEALILPAIPISIGASASGDTDVPPLPSFGVGADVVGGRLNLGNVSFSPPGAPNLTGIFSTTWILYYVDLLVDPVATLTASMTSGATSLSASATLPAASPTPVVFTFSATSTGGVTIGPGYTHNIAIGARVYGYTQRTGDTASDIAAALASAINGSVDPNATAVAAGATVTLEPVQNTGATVACTASDANTAQTLTETLASFVLIDSELIQVNATSGSSVGRAGFGSLAASHASGAAIYAVQTMTVYFPLDGSTENTNDWPTIVGTVPFAQRSLVAAAMWVTNELGDSPTATFPYCRYMISSGFPGLVAVAPPRDITGAVTISPSDTVLVANSTSAGWTQPIPSSVGFTGLLTIKKKSADSNVITLQAAAGELLDTTTTVVLSTPQDAVTLAPLVKGGWRIVGRTGATGGGIGTGDPFSPLTYDPTCGDGIVDATAAVASAVAMGGLYLPSGSVFLTSSVVLSSLPDGFTIYGGGRLLLKSGAGTPLLSISHTNDVKVVDVRLDGHSATGLSNPVVKVDTAVGVSLRGLRIVGGQQAGIGLVSSSKVRISDCDATAQSPGLSTSSSTWQAWCNDGIEDNENA